MLERVIKAFLIAFFGTIIILIFVSLFTGYPVVGLRYNGIPISFITFLGLFLSNLIPNTCGSKEKSSRSSVNYSERKPFINLHEKEPLHQHKDVTECRLCKEEGYGGISSVIKCQKCQDYMCETHTSDDKQICVKCFSNSNSE